jgi:hypothetical protein
MTQMLVFMSQLQTQWDRFEMYKRGPGLSGVLTRCMILFSLALPMLSGRSKSSSRNGIYRDDCNWSGLRKGGKGMGVLVGNLDSDGDLDLYVTNESTEDFL